MSHGLQLQGTSAISGGRLDRFGYRTCDDRMNARHHVCGAEDTDQVRGQFVEVVEDCGATPLHYLSGDVQYINSRASRWTENSRATVEGADVCVFVIVERFGSITWGTELRAALNAGVPFLVLCLEKTYKK